MATLWTASPDTQRSLWPLLEELGLAVVRSSLSGHRLPRDSSHGRRSSLFTGTCVPGTRARRAVSPTPPCTLGEAREEATGAQFAQGMGGTATGPGSTGEHSRGFFPGAGERSQGEPEAPGRRPDLWPGDTGFCGAWDRGHAAPT